VFGRLGQFLDRAAFRPDSLPPDVVIGIGLLPPLLAGLILFRLEAAFIACLALGIGGAIHIAARMLRQPLASSPALSALVGVAMVGTGSNPAWPLAIALLASILELLRGRFWSRSSIHTGLFAYVVVFFASAGSVATYQRPFAPAGAFFPEPIQQWSRYYNFSGAGRFLDPITLYVGNLAGPVLCTSLLAVVISIAWLWYARHLSLLALLGFLAGALVMALLMRWDPLFQLESGPAWFVAAFALADRRLLPEEPLLRPALGFAAGIFGIGVRAVPLYIEGLFLSVVGVQVAFSLLELGARHLAPRLPGALRRGLARRRGPASA
jgi:hypothetical protein